MTTEKTDSPDSHYVIRDRVRLHHLDWGNHGRHTIVLVHGVRLHAQVWNHFSRRFRSRFHIVAVDQRGHGDSGWAQDGGDAYHLEEYYQDLRTVIETRGLSRFTLIGHSLGGMVSMLYAARHSAQIERLVLVDISAGRPPVPEGTDLSRVTETPPPGEFETIEAAIAQVGRALSLAPPEMVAESVRHGMRRTDNGRFVWKYDPSLMQRKRPASAGFDFWDLIKSIHVPTLLQYGSHSKVVTPELAERMAQVMPQCRIERIEKAGHALFTDQPEAFARSVEKFLGG